MKYTAYLISGFAALAMTGCGGKEEAAVVNSEEDIAVVEVAQAYVRSVQHTRSYTANVQAYNLNNIAPSSYNRIKTISVDVGDHVKAGQVLATLDTSTADQQRITLEQLERDYNRAVQLLEIGSGTQSAVDQYKSQLDAQRALYNNTLTNTVLTSPISGVVTERNYDPGDMTGAQPILTVGQISPAVKVVINVNETDLPVVKLGMSVKVSFDAYSGEEFTGKISRVSPSVDTNTRTFPVEVQVTNSGERILPGMFARVEIDLGSQDNVVVPDRAVVKQTGSNNKYVYVYSNGTVAFKRVELGLRINDSYELLSGIENGDTVVIAGQTRLADGAPVRIKSVK